MKKQLTAVLMMLILVLSLSACAAAEAVQTLDRVEDKVEALEFYVKEPTSYTDIPFKELKTKKP